MNPLQSTTKSPGTATSDNVGDTYWSNPSNVLADDGSNATWGAVNGADISDTLYIRNFGFNIPTNASIEGVLVTVDGSGFSIYTETFMLVTDGPTLGQNKGNFDPLQTSYGGSEDLWNLALTPALVNDSDFGVYVTVGDISGGDGSASIDHVSVTVYWRYDFTVPPAEVPTRHDYKMFDSVGNYLGKVPKVISPFGFAQDINSVGSQLVIDSAQSPDVLPIPPFALGSIVQWMPGWTYRKKITIPRENVDAELTDFPVYVDLSDLGADFFSAVDSAGDDIRVTNQYGIAECAFELVSIDTSGETGELWFKAPILRTDDDNYFYIYFGNASASAYAATDTHGRNNVWNNYKAVMHLNENANTTSNGYLNSVGANNGTGTSMTDAAVTGKLGAKAADFDGVNDVITISSAFSLGVNTVVLSCWVEITNTSQNGAFIKVGSGSTGYGIGQGNTTFENNGNVLIMLFEGVRWIPTSGTLSAGWHLVHMVINASGVPSAYIDGVLVAAYSGTGAVTPTTSSFIGGYQASRWFSDPVDEVRIAGFIPSAAWIAAEYSNQNDTSAFYAVGVRETENAGGIIKNGNIVEAYETNYYYPNSKLMFRGQINRIETAYNSDASGIIRMLVHSDGRDMDNIVARGAPFTYTNDQTQTTSDNYFTVSQDSKGAAWERCGQSWIVGGAVTKLGRIQLRLLGNATVTVSIYDSPTTGNLLQSVTKAVNVGSATVIDFLLPNIIDVTAGQDYFFAISVAGGQSIRVYYKDNTNPYANGSAYTSSYAGGSGGGAYVVSSNDDLYFTTASATPSTTATYNSKDPSTEMLAPIIDDYNARGGLVTYDDADIEATGLSLSYTFITNTIYDALKKVLDMSPSGFYFYVDVGTGKLVFKKASTTPDIILTKGRHIQSLDLGFSIENVINQVLFSGGDTGGGDNLYSAYNDPDSASLYGVRLDRKSDNRVTIQGTADAIGNSTLIEYRGEQYDTTVKVTARTMDITQFKPGMTVGFRGFGSFIDLLVMQVIRLRYTPEAVELNLGTMQPRFNTQQETILRGLIAEQTVNNPSTPT